MKPTRANNSLFYQWWWTVDRYTLLAVATITAIGVVLVMAASPMVAGKIGLQSFHFVNRHVVFLILGAGCIFVFSMMPLVWIRRIAVISLVGCLALMVLVLLMDGSAKGAKRWIMLAGFSLQPSEFLKPFFAVVTAWFLARRNMEDDFPGYRLALGSYLLVVLLLILQPDFGMTVAVSVMWGAQMFLSGLPVLWIMAISVLGIGGAVGAYFLLPHVAHRINTFLNPATGDNYQTEKSLEAFINGGLLGRGPGEGVVKSSIPDAHTDFIFAVAGEEFGQIVCLIIIMLFAFVVVKGFMNVFRENDLFVFYATAGLLTMFGFQAMVNMGVALNLLPNTGMTLPFVSYGGSSTIATSITMGMILAFTRKRFGNKRR